MKTYKENIQRIDTILRNYIFPYETVLKKYMYPDSLLVEGIVTFVHDDVDTRTIRKFIQCFIDEK